MAQRRSRGEQIVRDVNFALWSANDVFRKVSADAAARGGAWMRRVQENVSAGAEHLGENLAASQQAQRGAVRAIVPLPRPAPIPTRPKAGPAKPAPATRAARLTTPANREPQSIGDHALEAALHVDAAVRGAADVLTASKADEIAAFLDAGVENAVASMSGLFDPASSDNRPFHVSLATQLKRQRERDGFDAENRTFARVTGQAGGLVAGVGLGSGFGSVTGLVRMLPNGAKLIRNTQATKRIGLDTRGINTLAATGGAIVGVADQAIEDRLNGSLADYLRAGGAGAASGLATRYGGPSAGGAVAGGAEPVLDSLSSGQDASLTEIGRGATYGAGGAGLTSILPDAVGKYGSAALPSRLKGQLGEGLSYAKTVARDGRLPKTQEKRTFGGLTTIADQVLPDGLLEAKFGVWAKLSKAQRAAFRALGPKYIIDHYLPKDIGRTLSFPTGIHTGSGVDVAPREAPSSP